VGEGLARDEVEGLYRRYGFFLRRRCLLLLRDAALADDALQDVFLKVMRSGAGVLTADRPMHWLYRVADRACLDLLRRTKHTRRAKELDDVAIDLPSHPGTVPELRRAAIELLDVLDDEEQAIAVMAFIDGMTQQEIADELGYSRMTIVKRVAAIRERAERLANDRARPRANREGRAS
jgi:RNA polymerase sigma-70 factor (ECF subfamily)